MKKTIENKNSEQPFVLICACSSCEHQIIIEHDKEDNLVYCQIHLLEHGFWRRLRTGLKFIFGYKCRYGHFEEFMFKPEHAGKLKELSELLLKKEPVKKNKKSKSSKKTGKK